MHVVGNGSANASYHAWKLGLRLNTPTFEFFLSEVRQGWEETLPGTVVHTIEREGVPLLEIRRVVPMTQPRVAFVRPGAVSDGHPPSPDRDGGWIRIESQDGRFDVDSILHGEPGVIAIAFETKSPGPVSLFMCHYLGLTVWIDGERRYDRKTVPFEYRATEGFPSVNPLAFDVTPAMHWFVADVTRARQHWGFGLYAPQSMVGFVEP